MLCWHWEKIGSPSRRRGLIARSEIGVFRIVPSYFMPLVDLMAGRGIPTTGYEVHLRRSGRTAQVLGKNAKTIAAAKDFADWHFERRCV